ncbi:hypothetical protein Q3A66_15215 [Hymenobacter sp. BT770]|uniref:hypothetical protein n=1 Tax=Hymenobacter sp. BT770 TaxID=2886942 RepID=UPI002671D864|nr:hypothetical protein [Hymenobacter sp. BT770]MCC3154518.1 hypothetical protein [Hymenobacter sp. BT770]MDO3416418.1 hypothetical protein [Hymenobacter sp. BT770]
MPISVSVGLPASRFFRCFRLAGVLFGTISLLSSCSSEPTETKSASSTKGTKPVATTPAATEAAPLRVSVFLEYSGGMKGFVPRGGADKPPTEFQQRIGALITETQVSGAIADRKYYLCENAAPKAVPFQQLRDVVQGEVNQAALGTELPQMLEGILNMPQATQQVSVVISDFIYGPARKSDFSQLPNLIRTSIAPVSQKQLAVAVFGEASRFYGSYFPAVKTPVQKRTLNGEKVPYYVWVIGPPALVARYTAEVFKNAPAQQAFYGLKTDTPAFAPLLTKLTEPKMKPSGSVYGEGNGLTMNVSDDTAEFTVGLNLKELPAAWQKPEFLAQHVRVRLPNGQASLLPNSVRLLTDDEQSGQPVLAPFTHVMRLRVSKLAAPTATLSLVLPAPETPEWVAAWSTTNDNTPAPRTFGLDQILAGVRQSYPTPLPPVFTVQLPLKNDK